MEMDRIQIMLSAQEKEVLATLRESDCARDVAVTVLQIQSIKNEIVANLMSFLVDHYGARTAPCDFPVTCTSAGVECSQQRAEAAHSSGYGKDVNPQSSPLLSLSLGSQRLRSGPEALSNLTLPAALPPRGSAPQLTAEGAIGLMKQEPELGSIDVAAESCWRHAAPQFPLVNDWSRLQDSSCLEASERGRANAYVAWRSGARMRPPPRRMFSPSSSESGSTSVRQRSALLQHQLRPTAEACVGDRVVLDEASSHSVAAAVSHGHGFFPPALWPRGPQRKRPRLVGASSGGSVRRHSRPSHERRSREAVASDSSAADTDGRPCRRDMSDLASIEPVEGLALTGNYLGVSERTERMEGDGTTPASSSCSVPSAMGDGPERTQQTSDFDEKHTLPLLASDDVPTDSCSDLPGVTGVDRGESTASGSTITVGAPGSSSQRPPSYPCPLCGRCFNDRSNLSKHFKTVHLQLKPYQCTWCSSKFSTSWNLRCHVSRCRARYYAGVGGSESTDGSGGPVDACATPS